MELQSDFNDIHGPIYLWSWMNDNRISCRWSTRQDRLLPLIWNCLFAIDNTKQGTGNGRIGVGVTTT
jgi:hypothetical protein